MHGTSTLINTYLDTADFRCIRASIEKKYYKEKLRLRCYKKPESDEENVFLEIKKKFKGRVYKRRIALTYGEAKSFFAGKKLPESRITSEIERFMDFHGHPAPAAAIIYEREPYFVTDEPTVRITFDSGLRCRFEDVLPECGTDGGEILPKDDIIMEIKSDGGMPLWLSAVLDDMKLYPRPFSKYANAYKKYIKKKEIF